MTIGGIKKLGSKIVFIAMKGIFEKKGVFNTDLLPDYKRVNNMKPFLKLLMCPFLFL